MSNHYTIFKAARLAQPLYIFLKQIQREKSKLISLPTQTTHFIYKKKVSVKAFTNLEEKLLY